MAFILRVDIALVVSRYVASSLRVLSTDFVDDFEGSAVRVGSILTSIMIRPICANGFIGSCDCDITPPSPSNRRAHLIAYLIKRYK